MMSPPSVLTLLALAVLGGSYGIGLPFGGLGAHAAAVPSKGTLQFTTATLNKVQQRLNESALRSWEIGTRATALLEYEWPDLFLYSSNHTTIPPSLSKSESTTGNLSSHLDVFQIVDQVLASRPTDILPFFQDGSAGDPPSVGIPFLIKNWTDPSASTSTSTPNYASAIDDQLYYLLNVVGRSPSGAISHRAPPEPVQLWADFISMAPPFIAYYGALHNNASLLTEAYDQIRLYREALLDDQTGLLQHIVLGDYQDTGRWATGNGWAVSGILRVLRIIQSSSSSFASTNTTGTTGTTNTGFNATRYEDDLLDWSSSLVKNVWTYQQSSGALLNYIDADPSIPSNSTFEDASGTALLAASTFRLAAIAPLLVSNSTLAAAERARRYIVKNVNADSDSGEDEGGWLTSVVNPMDWHVQGEKSAEAQAFVLMLDAAYRDWKAGTNRTISI